MFTNAGMNQFKSIFLGGKSNYGKRVVNSQKCFESFRKHNDLEELVLITIITLCLKCLATGVLEITLKKKLLKWSWEILTEIYKLPSEDLYVTVFEEVKKIISRLIKKHLIFGVK